VVDHIAFFKGLAQRVRHMLSSEALHNRRHGALRVFNQALAANRERKAGYGPYDPENLRRIPNVHA
jgi:hypothetical protein